MAGMSEDYSLVSEILHKVGAPVFSLKKKELREFLKQQDAEDLQVLLENQDWESYPTQHRIVLEELARREASKAAAPAAPAPVQQPGDHYLTDQYGTMHTTVEAGEVEAAAAATQMGAQSSDKAETAPPQSLVTGLSPSGPPAARDLSAGGRGNFELQPITLSTSQAAVRGEGTVSDRLVADPNYRISLSDPRVEKQHKKSKAKLEALLQKLNSVHGEDAEPEPGVNTEEVPFTQEEVLLLRSSVEAAIALHKPQSIPGQVIEVLKSLYEYLLSMEAMAKGLQVVGLIEVLTLAVEALKAFLIALGVPL